MNVQRRPYEDDALPYAEALERMLADALPLGITERVPLRGALGRILASDVHSPFDVPAHTNSAMDGYAFNAADLPTPGRALLRVAGQALAGHPFDGRLARGECVRITTGAVLPAGADTVAPQEDVEAHDGHILIDGDAHRAGQHVRHAGEDLARGALALPRGHRLRPADLGLCASLGVAELDLYRRLRVGFLSTGDELRNVGSPLAPGELYDSNRYALGGMLQRLGAELHDLGVVPDRPEALREAFAAAAHYNDVVISTGGVSVGEADHTRAVLDELGAIAFWRIAIRPGRPLAYGRIGDALFFGLPGNPVAVMVTFYQLVQPVLERLAGAAPTGRKRLRALALQPLRKRPGRTEFQRGRLETANDGSLGVRLTGAQGSGMLTSMSHADCFIVLDAARGPVAAGEWVDVESFAEFV